MEYVIIEATTAGSLEDKVKNYLKNYWTLQGGVSMGKDCLDKRVFLQAMTKIRSTGK